MNRRTTDHSQVNAIADDPERERCLNQSYYLRDSYWGLTTTLSLFEQLRWVWRNQIKQILYIGVGNGFVPEFLKTRGIDVVTLDINESLGPDVVGDLRALTSSFSEGAFECIMVCEVLEHLAFEDFDECVNQLSIVARQRVFVTLPVYERFLFRMSLGLKVFQREYLTGVWCGFTKRSLPSGHRWEIGNSAETRASNLEKKFKKYFANCDRYRLRSNPYHYVFDLRK